MKFQKTSFVIAIIVLFSFVTEAGFTQDTSPIKHLITQYRADQGALSRKYAVNISEQHFQRFQDFYQNWQQKLDDIDFGNLTQAQKVDYILFKNEIDRSLYFLNERENDIEAISKYLPAPDAIIAFINRRRVGTSVNGQDIATDFAEWSAEITTKQQQLEEDGYLTKWEARDLSRALRRYRSAIEEAYGFYFGYDPDFTWWVEEPFKKLKADFEKYEKFAAEHFDEDAHEDDGSGIVGNPIGEEEINRRLRFEMISYSPQELIDIANKQFTWTEQEMLKASRELGYGDDWKAALEAVKTTYVAEGEQPALVKDLAEEAVGFLEERNLVTIPELAKETWRMVMLSPEYQKIAPFFLGGETVRIAYPTNTMTHDEKMMSMRGNNPHFSKAVVHHELIPGHHLQQFMNQRYATHRRMFSTPFWTEGWALYWEMVLWNKGFPNNPEDKIGMLYWRMHRCARIVFSLNYHLGNWSPQQSIDYLVDKVGHEYANAEAEVRRSFEGNYGPLYQIAYMTGAMQFYSLRLQLVESGEMDEKEFHDAILHNNSIPVAMVKTLLTGEELSENYTPNWDFGDYIDGI
ncbi:MAG: DUF885 domain-containing protein [Balneolaceae bacterium]|nr:DUF885 domain-containing protein [Balneolaceae bacterium]